MCFKHAAMNGMRSCSWKRNRKKRQGVLHSFVFCLFSADVSRGQEGREGKRV